MWFAYTPDRKGEHPRRHLNGFTGSLQADGYAGFHHLYDTGRIREAACWAHVRRKFYDIEIAHHSPIASEAIERIAALYAVESGIRGKPPDVRGEIRQSQSKPLLDELRSWFEKMLSIGYRPAESETALAISLSCTFAAIAPRFTSATSTTAASRSRTTQCRRTPASTRRLPRSQELPFRPAPTTAENALPPSTDAFHWEPPSSTASTRKLYLRMVLERIADHLCVNRIAELLPWNLAHVAEPDTATHS